MLRVLQIVIALILLVGTGGLAHAQVPSFSKAFSPSTIGPGAATRLVFTITNSTGSPVTQLAFSDSLPASVTIASAPNATTTCSTAVVTAPVGGTTISLAGDGSPSGASVGSSSSCTVAVNVTSSTAGAHLNTSGDLTSSAGNSGTASATLTVSGSLPGFSKAFSPSTVAFGATVPLTFTIDNTSGPNLTSLSFSDTFPTGMTVASPTGASTTCGEPNSTTTFAPTAGASTISFSNFGSAVPSAESLLAGETCTVSVNVVANASGTLNNVSSALATSAGASGFAAASLIVTPPSLNGVAITKQFLTTTVPPGANVDVRFTLQNSDSSNAATAISFSDDLNAMLAGATATVLPANGFCGAGSTITGTSVLTMTGGSLASRASCDFTVRIQVPSAAPGGTVTNTTSATSATINAATVAGDPATAQFTVSTAIPALTKSFTNDPVAAGDTVTLQYTLTSSSSSLSGIGFTDNVTILTDAEFSSVALPAGGFCGAGATAFLVTLGTGQQGIQISGASLAVSSSCMFSVDIDIPAGRAPASIVSTTSDVTSDSGSGAGASDTLVVSAPALSVAMSKSFTDDPVVPGGTVTLEFNLSNNTEATGVTDLTFTDDLDAMLSGAVAVGLPASNVCGAGSTLSGTSLISLSGGALAASDTCTFSVTVQVPGGATAGSYPNTTSDVSGDAGSGIVTAASSAASDTLVVSDVLAVTAVKSFTDDPVSPGDTVTLEFTLTNPNASDGATAVSFTDSLSTTLSGLVAIGLPASNICGTGSSISGTSTLSFSGGVIAAASSCTFSVTLQVPAGATPGDYGNVTGSISSTVAATGLVSAGAGDTLTVRSPIEDLVVSKSFTDDPVVAGDPVTLQFTLDNSTGVDALTGIAFTDDLDAMLSGATASGLPAGGFCGGGSTISGTSTLTISGASLAAGVSCTFSATVMVPGGASFGTYTNTTSTVSVTSGSFSGTVPAATDQLVVSPTIVTFSKSFTDDPVLPGETVTVEYTVFNPAAGGTLTNIRFNDDFDSALTGLVATGLPANNVCGAGSTLTGTTLIALNTGTLAPNTSCTFSVTLQVPASAPPGSYASTSSVLTESAAQIAVAASDTLAITSPVTNMVFTKSFTDDPIAPNGTATLQFTITNPDTISAITSIGFTDDLNAMLTGATAGALPGGGFCGGGATISGTTSLTMSGGALAAGASCSFAVSVLVPSGAAPGSYTNTTGALAGTVNGVAGTAGTATDMLQVVASPMLVVTPATDLNANGPVGGPFSPNSETYTLQNTGAAALSYTAAGDQAFFDVSPASGTIAAGGTTTVSVSFNATANGLAVNNYTGTTTFTNLTNASATTTRAVNLTVNAVGSVTIVQTTSAGDGTFTFTSVTAGLSFPLTTAGGTATSGAISLVAGTYQVTQVPPAGFGLVSASCNDSDSTIDVSTRTASIVLAAAEAVVCTFNSANSRERTVEVINRFLHRRADLILSSEPDGGRRIDRLRNPDGGTNGSGAPFNFGVTASGGVSSTFETSLLQIRSAYAAQDARKDALVATSGVFAVNGSGGVEAPKQLWDFWISGQITHFDDDTGGDGDGMFGILHFGTDYRVSSSLLVGAMVQFDYLDQQWNDLGASASGTGWMAGPYATVRITDNLFFDTRAAWGTSSNEISPFNTYTDNFDTQRWLVRAGLIGDWQFGDWQFRPSANVAYMREDQEAYVDSLSVAIPGQTVSLGQFDFGPSISYRYKTVDGLIVEPTATLTGIWNFSQDTAGVTTTTNSAAVDFRAKAEVGVRVLVPSGVSVEAHGSYDGIGVQNYDAITGRAVLSIPF